MEYTPRISKGDRKITTCNRLQCSRLKFSMSFKRDVALQNIPLSKEPFKMQPQLENEDVS
jgi:hypothetical protein